MNTTEAYAVFYAAMRAKPDGLDAHRQEVAKLQTLVETDEAKAKKFAELQPILRQRSKNLFGALWAPHARQEAENLAADYRDLAERFGLTDEEQDDSFAKWQASL